LGCARNEVDSEELAGRLHADGWEVTTDGERADVVLVNTCGFVDKAKQDSIQTLMAAADTGAKVVAAGCMAERYGRELAQSMPEAHAVLGFDDYPEIAARLDSVLAGERLGAGIVVGGQLVRGHAGTAGEMPFLGAYEREHGADPRDAGELITAVLGLR
jgi:tRNA A37 methylthiotransferase MiaB